MKKLFLVLAAAAVSFTATADEGMWMLPFLQKMNIKQMKQRGCKLSAEDIYSVNKSSLKDAIVVFGGGCTGEIVSPEGLLLTNHHCGYGSIQALSSVEHDYLQHGFWARSREEEIPAPGLRVQFVRQIVDVTPDVVGAVPDLARGVERDSLTGVRLQQVRERLSEQHPGLSVQIVPFFGGNQYFAFVNEVYTDVRLVGTPPNSIGKFGGDTDNWMWPRHTGDFSVFRVYAGEDNRPAAYSPENRPYKAEKFLKISLDGVDENDFAMIMGFPGSTERYMTSYEIDRMLETSIPNRVLIRGERQRILKEDMDVSDKVRIQYASKYAMSSNYWKNSIGMDRGIRRLDVKAKKQAQEQRFQAWAEANTLPEEGFIDALPMIASSIEIAKEENHNRQIVSEALFNAVEILAPAVTFDRLTEIGDADRLRKAFVDWYKDYNAPTDRKVAKRMLALAREKLTSLPTFYTEIVDEQFGGDTDAYVDYLYDNTIFTSEEQVMELIDDFSREKIEADPAALLARSVMEFLQGGAAKIAEGQRLYADGHRLYVAGLMRMDPEKAWASDANFTLRLTYGRVLPYEPADGIEYQYYTTLKGVMEKENPDNDEFVVPERLKELYEKRDYGRYANKKGELPVAFLADCDITGGNSGSPVLNARGELVGLAFDGNWEAMSGDVAFEPELQRTISVDIRYVLFVIDKFAGAGWLLDEMQID